MLSSAAENPASTALLTPGGPPPENRLPRKLAGCSFTCSVVMAAVVGPLAEKARNTMRSWASAEISTVEPSVPMGSA